jgi:uncharacterized protein YbaR (Trm112 family)
MESTWLSLLFALPVATLGVSGVWLWLRRKKTAEPAPRPRPPRPLLPAAATADPRLLPQLRGEALEALICPACRREYDGEFRHCPYDASGLVPQSQAAEVVGGMFCPRCRRGFEPGTRSCPNDAEDLIPYPLFKATSAPHDHDGLRKICPLCTSKFEGGASFCGRDGSELVLMN